MDRNDEKLREYITLFGLDEDYSLNELSASFRTLAKLNHPDIIRDESSKDKMIIINEGYEFLKKTYDNGEIDKYKNKKDEYKKEDPYYDQYKKAFLILKKAFENYFGDGEAEEKKLFRNEATLRKKLQQAKDEFSKLVNDLPYSEWVNDSIDKISSINKWLD